MLKFLLVVILFAAATYFLVRAAQERGLAAGNGSRTVGGRARGPRAPRRPRTPPRIIAPDDDEDFLRDLDRKKRKKPNSES